MVIELFGHPFSSYTWKVLIAFYETDTPFVFRTLRRDAPEDLDAMHAVWPLGKFPVLIDDGEAIGEASIIVEHVAPFMVPGARSAAREVRMLDRVFDNYVMANMQGIVNEHLPHLTEAPDPARVERARAALDTAYAWLDDRLAGRTWAAGDAFTLADCAAAPSLFYADWAHPIGDERETLKAYRARLLARPSVARAVDEARPYRAWFPLGAPDRD